MFTTTHWILIGSVGAAFLLLLRWAFKKDERDPHLKKGPRPKPPPRPTAVSTDSRRDKERRLRHDREMNAAVWRSSAKTPDWEFQEGKAPEELWPVKFVPQEIRRIPGALDGVPDDALVTVLDKHTSPGKHDFLFEDPKFICPLCRSKILTTNAPPSHCPKCGTHMRAYGNLLFFWERTKRAPYKFSC